MPFKLSCLPGQARSKRGWEAKQASLCPAKWTATRLDHKHFRVIYRGFYQTNCFTQRRVAMKVQLDEVEPVNIYPMSTMVNQYIYIYQPDASFSLFLRFFPSFLTFANQIVRNKLKLLILKSACVTTCSTVSGFRAPLVGLNGQLRKMSG